MRIFEQEIDHIPERHIDRGAERDHGAEADVGADPPVEEGAAENARIASIRPVQRDAFSPKKLMGCNKDPEFPWSPC
jgi:hypothetical protein